MSSSDQSLYDDLLLDFRPEAPRGGLIASRRGATNALTLSIYVMVPQKVNLERYTWPFVVAMCRRQDFEVNLLPDEQIADRSPTLVPFLFEFQSQRGRHRWEALECGFLSVKKLSSFIK